MDTSHWASTASMVENMRKRIHVLFVDHEIHGQVVDMLEHFFLKVTTVKFASTALAILSKGKATFDLLLANIHSPDACGFRLLREAVQMELPVILLFEKDDDVLMKRALEVGALLCIKKPITMEVARYFWQLVLWEKTRISKIKIQRYREMMMALNNNMQIGVGENATSQESHNNTKIKCENSSTDHEDIHENKIRTKVWTEWTQELHDKFMVAVRTLGEGRCYPKDILELMNVPGLTRMQVASHLQKCRSGTWVSPHKRKPKAISVAAKRVLISSANPRKFGFMPSTSNLQNKTPNQYSQNKVFVMDSKPSIPFPPTTQYFEFPNVDSFIQSFGDFEEVPMTNNAPVMNNANVGETSKRDDDGKTQVVVKKEDE